VSDETSDLHVEEQPSDVGSFEIPGLDDVLSNIDDLDELDDLDAEQLEQLEEAQRAMADVREQLSSVPAEVVITNHAMGLYELAAIHLSAETPDFVQAVLAIDALACLVDGLGSRLGPEAPMMADALNNIRLAFVQIKGQSATS
jgi:uncharacterized protein with GYD domain